MKRHTDKQRLDFLLKAEAEIRPLKHNTAEYRWLVNWGWEERFSLGNMVKVSKAVMRPTPRQAIDAAMRKEKRNG